MRLIVGLGNPGERYQATPHNLGFLVVDELSRRFSIAIRRPEDESLLGIGRSGEWDVALAKPQTYMNLSGRAVRKLLARCECTPQDLVIVVDDLDLPWGQTRIRKQGSAGTHNGLRSIVEEIGTLDFPRIRMGIQPDHPVQDPARYVLAPIEKTLRPTTDEFVSRGADAAAVLVNEGIKAAMNRFNGAASPAARKPAEQ